MKNKSIYYFSRDRCDGDLTLLNLLGSKGANLAEMCKINVPVPPGFTISTSVCVDYNLKNRLNEEFYSELLSSLAFLENDTGCSFGDVNNPLLVSVRSGAIHSMPGMLDTVLNVGLNDQTVIGLAQKKSQRFAYDSYRRFIQMYSNVVLNIDSCLFEEVIENKKRSYNISADSELNEEILKEIIEEFKKIVFDYSSQSFPQDVYEQLRESISAVFGSWMNDRAVAYRDIHNIASNLGTAVNVQAMVFGNMDIQSATGVVFTRNPGTGEKGLFGEFLINAQGEDVVAGTRTPILIDCMKESMGSIYDELLNICQILERHYRNMQDVEFTIQSGRLWILQTRNGKRTAQAAVKIAVDMVNEGLVSKKEAIMQIDSQSFCSLLHPVIEGSDENLIIAKGLPASPGASSGIVVFTSKDAEKFKKDGHDVILVRIETNPEDIRGMSSSVGIVTARGGMTSHAAVVARGMGKPCICSVSGIFIDKSESFFTTEKGVVISKGDSITINGSNGEVMLGLAKTVIPKLSEEFYLLMKWVDEVRVIEVKANADTPDDVGVAMKFDVDGIGLCRTEHMFFSDDRISFVQEMILSYTTEERKKVLSKLELMQEEDFEKMFYLVKGKPITIRLLDPPLHEFLPHDDKSIFEISERTGVAVEKLKSRMFQLSEKNPMLGHRGCRLAISHPEIYEMQVRAIFSAVVQVKKKHDIDVVIEIMIPFVMHEKELELINNLIDKVAIDFCGISYSIGTMIELPRAALISDRIAKYADFFSFGTNDLTQTTMGLSRDDTVNFINLYKELGILKSDPFESLDMEGVGKLIEISSELGKKAFKDLKLGICGEHGGNLQTIEFCHKLGLNYVSCSPYRVAIAKMIAAQCAIKRESDSEFYVNNSNKSNYN